MKLICEIRTSENCLFLQFCELHIVNKFVVLCDTFVEVSILVFFYSFFN